ncbi:MAG TPA: hypothetical protein VF883_10885 [Thermoanaerobaculia bacterium]
MRAGDQVRYGGDNGKVEFVANERRGDVTADWYVEEYGGGVMMNLENSGSLFLPGPQIDEELELVSRAAPDSKH